MRPVLSGVLVTSRAWVGRGAHGLFLTLTDLTSEIVLYPQSISTVFRDYETVALSRVLQVDPSITKAPGPLKKNNPERNILYFFFNLLPRRDCRTM